MQVISSRRLLPIRNCRDFPKFVSIMNKVEKVGIKWIKVGLKWEKWD